MKHVHSSISSSRETLRHWRDLAAFGQAPHGHIDIGGDGSVGRHAAAAAAAAAGGAGGGGAGGGCGAVDAVGIRHFLLLVDIHVFVLASHPLCMLHSRSLEPGQPPSLRPSSCLVQEGLDGLRIGEEIGQPCKKLLVDALFGGKKTDSIQREGRKEERDCLSVRYDRVMAEAVFGRYHSSTLE